MLSDESGGRSALIILLLLPAPLTAIAIMLGLVLVIADSNAVNLEVGRGDTQVQVAPQPTRTLSAEVAALSTISAAPVRPAVAVAAAPAEAAAALGYDESLVQTGQVNYLGTCASCHGTDALGVAGLGKTLIDSEFMRARSDQELLEFVIAGRQPFDPENTTGLLMPPRGGNPGLTDDDLLTIIAYVRTLDGFAPDGSGVEVAAPEMSEAEVSAAAPAEAAALEYDESLVQTGQVNYLGTCAGCHGTDALGVAGLGKTLIDSEFMRARSDQELLEFVIAGRQPFDPENTTGLLMPPRGGNPGLTDDDLLTIIAYVRTLDGFGVTVGAAETPEEAEDAAEDVAESSSESVEYVRPDVSALLASLGVELEAPPPAPDRDGEAIFNTLCGTRYEEFITVPPDYCDILLEIAPELGEGELFALLQAGSPIWDADNETGVHFPARGGYPAMNDAEIANFIDYLAEIAAE